MNAYQRMVLRLLLLCYNKLVMVPGVCEYEEDEAFIAEVEEVLSK